mmetsp:Transcript_29257/g.68084  ORF Transcript_29257/g.68084 Transcript_29257/m.68084 type:complete len:294 (-) Transcript_29257:101-982(-)
MLLPQFCQLLHLRTIRTGMFLDDMQDIEIHVVLIELLQSTCNGLGRWNFAEGGLFANNQIRVRDDPQRLNLLLLLLLRCLGLRFGSCSVFAEARLQLRNGQVVGFIFNQVPYRFSRNELYVKLQFVPPQRLHRNAGCSLWLSILRSLRLCVFISCARSSSRNRAFATFAAFASFCCTAFWTWRFALPWRTFAFGRGGRAFPLLAFCWWRRLAFLPTFAIGSHVFLFLLLPVILPRGVSFLCSFAWRSCFASFACRSSSTRCIGSLLSLEQPLVAIDLQECLGESVPLQASELS